MDYMILSDDIRFKSNQSNVTSKTVSMQRNVSAIELDDESQDDISEDNEFATGSTSKITFRGAGGLQLLNAGNETIPEHSIDVDEVGECESDDGMDIPMMGASTEVIADIAGYDGEPPSIKRLRKLQKTLLIQADILKIERLGKSDYIDGYTDSEIETSGGVNKSWKLSDISNFLKEKGKGKTKLANSSSTKRLELEEFDPIAWMVLTPEICRCPVCDKVIEASSFIRRHVLTHSVLRDIRCDCSPKAKYARIDSFRRHTEVHPDCAPRVKQAELENSYFFSIITEIARCLKLPDGDRKFDSEEVREFYKFAIYFRQVCQRVIKPSDPKDLESFYRERKFIDHVLHEYRHAVDMDTTIRADIWKMKRS